MVDQLAIGRFNLNTEGVRKFANAFSVEKALENVYAVSATHV